MNTYCEPCKRHYKNIKPHLKTKKHLKNLQTYQTSMINIEENGEEIECSICLDNISSNNLHTTSCKHTFHKKCIGQWLKHHNNCPNCRQEFQPIIREQPIFRQPSVNMINILLDTLDLFERMDTDIEVLNDVRMRLHRELNI